MPQVRTRLKIWGIAAVLLLIAASPAPAAGPMPATTGLPTLFAEIDTMELAWLRTESSSAILPTIGVPQLLRHQSRLMRLTVRDALDLD